VEQYSPLQMGCLGINFRLVIGSLVGLQPCSYDTLGPNQLYFLNRELPTGR
jgi:hypothetical protein